ncbi:MULTISPECIES: hypothetical protein [Maribacter]|uniref:DUF4221 domain-containing protein n=1 Tax=Maribacter flavus TaxID=1658664 RepID=A0ABU7IIB4_9FLAO|nr:MULTISPECIES: hypothetical protein [Maribacter]MDC6405562.1 hypothetical protein [Maribacter sp. PR66]MEE1972670.1 hypothetical protein [Maribacter flavus]
MKTYTYTVRVMLTVFLAACSKSATEPLETETPASTKGDYTILLETSGSLTTARLQATADDLTLKASELEFPLFSDSEITFASNNSFSFYEVTETCNGKVLLFDFNTGNYKLIDTFLNLDACNLEVTSVSHDSANVFLTFTKSEIDKEDSHFVRIIDQNDTDNQVDIPLDLKPIQSIPSQGKLFVLTLDTTITDENGISVIEIGQQSVVYEKLVGFNAKKIFKDPDGDIVISYPELHTTVNRNTFEEAYTQYGENIRPNLYQSVYATFDTFGKLYYTMNMDMGGDKNPAVYDFQANKATLYFFENFLSNEQITLLNIKSATAIAYDLEHDYIVIGYAKTDGTEGGILRITPTPDFRYIDAIDLEGLPRAIIMQ